MGRGVRWRWRQAVIRGLSVGSRSVVGSLSEIIDRYGLVMLDGALATELEAQGCDLDDPLWSAKLLIDNPALIKAVHRSYLEAGADCIITSSYQATLAGFIAKGKSAAEANRLLASSVMLARQVRDQFWAELGERQKSHRPKPLIAASVGPYGASLADGSEYRGDYDLDEDGLYHFHRHRMSLLVAEGPDLLACETIPCMSEARAVVRCLAECEGITCWVSFSCRDGFCLRSGERIADCARWLDRRPGVEAVGVNCTEPRYVTSLIGEIRKETAKPIIVYPNSGEKYDVDHRSWSGREGLPVFAELAQGWFRAGARLIGGCCRTSPQDIREIADWARKICVIREN